MVTSVVQDYKALMFEAIEMLDDRNIQSLAELMMAVRSAGKRVYICGNGGSASNAIHLANDFLYGVAPNGRSINVEALSANPAVITCLANDIAYDQIFAHQLKVKASPGDVLMVLSGSGDSSNIVAALECAKEIGVETVALVGYGGGKAKQLADRVVHFKVNDMQVS